jgi:hypothetical protein
MTVQKVGAWLQIIGNFGLLAGLVLVAVQINQSNSLARASHASVMFEEETANWRAQMGENPSAVFSKAVSDPASLTPEEVFVIRSSVWLRLNILTRSAQMEEFGVMGDGWRSVIAGYGNWIGGMPVAREYYLRVFADDPRPWMKELTAAVRSTPKRATYVVVEKGLEAARSYGKPPSN